MDIDIRVHGLFAFIFNLIYKYIIYKTDCRCSVILWYIRTPFSSSYYGLGT